MPASSIRAHNERMETCEQCSKSIHPSRYAAGKQAAQVGASARLARYKCPAGNGWHVGHSAKTRKRPVLGVYRRDRMLILPPQALAREMMSR